MFIDFLKSSAFVINRWYFIFNLVLIKYQLGIHYPVNIQHYIYLLYIVLYIIDYIHYFYLFNNVINIFIRINTCYQRLILDVIIYFIINKISVFSSLDLFYKI